MKSVVSTDDGSLGFCGFVTERLSQILNSPLAPRPSSLLIYTCGPEPMMKRVAQIAIQRGIQCQVAVERAMACRIRNLPIVLHSRAQARIASAAACWKPLGVTAWHVRTGRSSVRRICCGDRETHRPFLLLWRASPLRLPRLIRSREFFACMAAIRIGGPDMPISRLAVFAGPSLWNCASTGPATRLMCNWRTAA